MFGFSLVPAPKGGRQMPSRGSPCCSISRNAY